MALVERGADGELVELPELGEPDRIVLGLGRDLRVDRHRCRPLPVRNNSLTRRIEID